MTRAQELKFIERQRGRARRIKKSGLYSPALSQLERRAEKAGINIFSKSSKMTPEEREQQLNLLWQFSKAPTSTLEGTKDMLVLNKVAVRRASGKMSQEEISKVSKMTPRQRWKWYTEQKNNMNEDKFISDLWDVLKNDYQNFSYKEGGNSSVTNLDIKDIMDDVEYQGETESLNIIDTLERYLKSSSSPELTDIKDILEGKFKRSEPEPEPDMPDYTSNLYEFFKE